jgi:hypothetical protein
VLAWSQAATTSLFTLGGVLIGSVVGAIVHWRFERRRERADVRQVKRLIASEVLRVWLHYEGMLDHGCLPTTRGTEEVPFLPDAVWREYRPTLARHLSDDEYNGLALVMNTVATTRSVIVEQELGLPLSAELRSSLESGHVPVGVPGPRRVSGGRGRPVTSVTTARARRPVAWVVARSSLWRRSAGASNPKGIGAPGSRASQGEGSAGGRSSGSFPMLEHGKREE